MVDYDRADAKEKTGKMAVYRIDGLILIWSAIKGRKEIGEKLVEAQVAQHNIDKMFGL